jgi:hypothetical protein
MDWETDAKPVLVATYGMVEDPEIWEVTSRAVAKALHRAPAEVARTMGYLSDAGYLVTENSIDQISGEIMVEVERLTEKSLQQLSGWPVAGYSGDVASMLVEIIEERITDADPEERNRLEKLRDAIAGVGRDVLVQVLAKLATREI